MVQKRILHPNTVFDSEALLSFFNEHNIKHIHASKIWHTFMNNPTLSFDSVPGLPKNVQLLLSQHFVPLTSSLETIQHSKDNKTTKLLIRLQDNNMIEAVIIRHNDTRSGGHNVICVSSQIGCKMACTFCATGTLGLLGNLTNGEILEQLVHAKYHVDNNIRNVVFMGMGEPLDNYDEVSKAVHGMHDRSRFNLSFQHITMSTVGVVYRMKQFSNDFPKVNLALSLHAPNQEIRKKIVPTSKSFTVDKLMDAIKYHVLKTGNKVFIEYITIGNVNADEQCAHQLANLFLRLQSSTQNERNDINTTSMTSGQNINNNNDNETNFNENNQESNKENKIDNENIDNKIKNENENEHENGNEAGHNNDKDKSDNDDINNTVNNINVKEKIIINLIPYNPTDVGNENKFESPTEEQLQTFKNIIVSYGIFCTIRKSTTSGQDIDGACGQLALKGTCAQNNKQSDIEDLASVLKSSDVVKNPKTALTSNNDNTDKRNSKNENHLSKTKQIFQISISFTLMVVIMSIIFKLFGIEWRTVLSL